MTLDLEAKLEVEEGVQFVAKTPKLMEILETVADVYGVGKMDMMSLRRFSNIVEARDGFYWCARALTPRTFTEIGRFFGKRDHSTVWAGIVRVSQRFDKHHARLNEVVKRLGVKTEKLKP